MTHLCVSRILLAWFVMNPWWCFDRTWQRKRESLWHNVMRRYVLLHDIAPIKHTCIFPSPATEAAKALRSTIFAFFICLHRLLLLVEHWTWRCLIAECSRLLTTSRQRTWEVCWVATLMVFTSSSHMLRSLQHKRLCNRSSMQTMTWFAPPLSDWKLECSACLYCEKYCIKWLPEVFNPHHLLSPMKAWDSCRMSTAIVTFTTRKFKRTLLSM